MDDNNQRILNRNDSESEVSNHSNSSSDADSELSDPEDSNVSSVANYADSESIDSMEVSSADSASDASDAESNVSEPMEDSNEDLATSSEDNVDTSDSEETMIAESDEAQEFNNEVESDDSVDIDLPVNNDEFSSESELSEANYSSESQATESESSEAESSSSSSEANETENDSAEPMEDSSEESASPSEDNSDATDSEQSVGSESDEALDVNPDDNEPHGDYRPFYQLGAMPDELNQVLPRSHWKVRDYLLTFLSKSITKKETYVSLLESFEIINAAHIRQNVKLPKNKPQLWKMIGRNYENISYRVFCTKCKQKVGDGKKATIQCGCESCGPDKRKQPLGVYMHVSVKAQLIELFKRPNMEASLRYRFTRVKRNVDGIEDSFDGEEFHELEEGFLI